jgi:hypothetical protein
VNYSDTQGLADPATQVKVLEKLGELNDHRKEIYVHLIRVAASDVARRQLEEKMTIQH